MARDDGELEVTPKSVPLAKLLVADVAAAAAASFCVAPFISMIDQAIIQRMSGTATSIGASLADSFKTLVTKPQKFLTRPAFLLVWGVYGGTYIAANFVQTFCTINEASDNTRHLSKLFGVSAVNLGLNISKDRIFARMFGKGSPRPLPVASYLLFGARDSLTVFASFNIAPVAADKLAASAGIGIGAAATVAQLACPIGMQWFSAPIHLLGLDIYNRDAKAAATVSRYAAVRSAYVGAAVARSARIGPAFGVGVLLNNPVRARFHDMC